MIASAAAQPDALAAAVTRSLDRKVCNTLNTCCIQRDAAETLVPAFLDALEQAAQARGTACRLHVVGDADGLVPDAWFTTKTTITRADQRSSGSRSPSVNSGDVLTRGQNPGSSGPRRKSVPAPSPSSGRV